MDSYKPLHEGCPVCNCGDAGIASGGTVDAYRLRCKNCGEHLIARSAYLQLERMQLTREARALLAYRFRKIPPDDLVGSHTMDACAAPGDLPRAGECIDNLLAHLAAGLSPGDWHSNIRFRWLLAAIGAASEEGVAWAVNEAKVAGFLRVVDEKAPGIAVTNQLTTLTAAGWTRLDDLMRNGRGSRHAFMAMDYNDTPTDIGRFYRDHLAKAVGETGFELRPTNHTGKTAELIDNRMRVELRTSRFVVCDLSDGNHGAYWEAGFAEGLGRPVFYLCHHDTFNSADKHTRPHFDTNRQPIIRWRLEDPAPALAELKNMIRATLPGEARMED